MTTSHLRQHDDMSEDTWLLKYTCLYFVYYCWQTHRIYMLILGCAEQKPIIIVCWYQYVTL
jgi:hypothetical protein